MRQHWPLLFAFVAGILAGALAAAAFVGGHWKGNFADWYVIQVADQAQVAKEISSGRGRQLAERIRSRLPSYVRALQGQFAAAEGAAWALWAVQDAYQAAETAPPPELQEVFATLPPRASCEPPSARAEPR